MKKLSLLVLIFILAAALSALFACDIDTETFSVNYTSSVGGSIAGEAFQTVKPGEDAKTVTAVPDDGYYFVKWSDFYTQAERQDKDVQKDLSLTAMFERNSYVVKYSAQTGGSITGNTMQFVSFGASGSTVKAVPNAGYRFTGWSDGSVSAERTDTKINSNLNLTAVFEKITYTLTYTAEANGSILGNGLQSVKFNEDATAVTAIPSKGYVFVRWSDGNTNAKRKDTEISSNLNLTAVFQILTKTFTYEYNRATDNCSDPGILLSYDTFSEAILQVPQKEHFTFHGWYLDKEMTVSVSDNNGSVVIDETVFDGDATLYAKWTPNESFTYKILMVFVTEAHATLINTDGFPVAVDYVMTDVERQVCGMIPGQISDCINGMFDGLVKFEIDTYFTTNPVCTENFQYGSNAGLVSYAISAEDIPEVQHMLPNYSSVFTTFGMDDYDGILHSVGGSAGKKYAMIHLESIFKSLKLFNIPYETLLNPENMRWDSIKTLYLHEFTHTVENHYKWGTIYEYHAIFANLPQGDSLEYTRLYLLHLAVIDGEKVGIPYDFWKEHDAT